MEGFCRGCLTRYEDPTDLLQYTEKNRRLYVYSTGLQVKRADVFSFQLCKECYVTMKIACKFKKQCRTTDKRLKSFLALKETGDTTDFCTFLKNNDDSLLLKFPVLNGNNTPSFQKAKEDDNESTCTSIRNFMTNILNAAEIPDTEARIIQEVIEEEADVLDESLDSHWLQDDVSIDTDFRLDFSFSAFSTPRSENNQSYFPPPKLKEINEDQQQDMDQESFIAAKKILLKPSNENNQEENLIAAEEIISEPTAYYDYETKKAAKTINELENENEVLPNQKIISNCKKLLIENESLKPDKVCINITNTIAEKDCIDKNLAQALENSGDDEFSLNGILATPPICPGPAGASTPTINNIIFGDKLSDVNSNSGDRKVGHCIENYQYIDGSEGDIDVLDDFFNKETGEYIGDIKAKEEPKEIFDEEYVPTILEKPGKCDYDLSDFSCKLCNKFFSSIPGVKRHFSRIHKRKIYAPMNKKHLPQEVVCDYCGATFNFLTNLKRHIQSHMILLEDKGFKCKKCSIVFSRKDKLKMHMTTHIGKRALKPRNNKHICDECGHISTTISNLRVHQRRHTTNYTHTCIECDRGFFRRTDWVSHMRTHTGMRPFSCTYCERSFGRRDSLNRHMKLHIGEKPYQCSYCNHTFINKHGLLSHIRRSIVCKKLRENIAEHNDSDKYNDANEQKDTNEQREADEIVEPDFTLLEEFVDRFSKNREDVDMLGMSGDIV